MLVGQNQEICYRPDMDARHKTIEDLQKLPPKLVDETIDYEITDQGIQTLNLTRPKSLSLTSSLNYPNRRSSAANLSHQRP